MVTSLVFSNISEVPSYMDLSFLIRFSLIDDWSAGPSDACFSDFWIFSLLPLKVAVRAAGFDVLSRWSECLKSRGFTIDAVLVFAS